MADNKDSVHQKNKTWRWDGFSNALTDIGTGGDPHSHTRISPGTRLSQQELDELYETGRFARKIVEKPPKDAMRPDIVVKDDSGPLFIEQFREHSVKWHIREALFNARQTGGGAVMLVADDGRDLDEPIDWENIEELTTIHAFDRFDLSVNEYEIDLEAENYRKPRLYDFHPDNVGGAGRSAGGSEDDYAKVHADRIIRFEGARIREFRKPWYNGWAQPVLESLYETLQDIGICTDAIGSSVHQFQYAVLKIAGLHELLVENDNGRELFRERLHAMEESKSILNAIALDADRDEDIEQKSADIGQAVKAYRVFQENLAYDAQMSMSMLFGQMPKGLSTRDDTGRQNYFDYVEDSRDYDIKPALFKIARVLSYAQNSEDLDESTVVEYGPLDELSAPDGAQVFSQRADGHTKLVDAGIESEQEANERLFEDNAMSRVPENESRRRRDGFDGPEDLPENVREMNEDTRDEWVSTYRALREYRQDWSHEQTIEKTNRIFDDGNDGS